MVIGWTHHATCWLVTGDCACDAKMLIGYRLGSWIDYHMITAWSVLADNMHLKWELVIRALSWICQSKAKHSHMAIPTPHYHGVFISTCYKQPSQYFGQLSIQTGWITIWNRWEFAMFSAAKESAGERKQNWFFQMTAVVESLDIKIQLPCEY